MGIIKDLANRIVKPLMGTSTLRAMLPSVGTVLYTGMIVQRMPTFLPLGGTPLTQSCRRNPAAGAALEDALFSKMIHTRTEPATRDGAHNNRRHQSSQSIKYAKEVNELRSPQVGFGHKLFPDSSTKRAPTYRLSFVLSFTFRFASLLPFLLNLYFNVEQPHGQYILSCRFVQDHRNRQTILRADCRG